MAFKCAIQVTGLVRGEPTGKHRSNGKAILGEMGRERISSSDTLNRTLSSQNTYTGMSDSGFAVWDDMVSRADEYKQSVKGKDKSGHDVIRYRGLRKDAVIGCAIIINPPYDECKEWTREEYDKFYADSIEILHGMKPEIFRSENRQFRAVHVDEGLATIPPQLYDEHVHEVYDCIDEHGCYCGNKIDAQFLSELNKIYPSEMRKRGWDMENLDTTDWDLYKNDPAYHEDRKEKAKNFGKAVNEHIHQQTVKSLREANALLVDVKQTETAQNRIAIEQENTRLHQEQIQRQLQETAESQHKMQEILEEQDRAYQKNIATYERETKAYQKRYSTLFSAIQGTFKKLPDSVNSSLKEVIRGMQYMDTHDRFGINRLERELESSKSAYSDAKKRLEIAISDDRAQTQKRRMQMADSVSKDVSAQNDDYGYELEF